MAETLVVERIVHAPVEKVFSLARQVEQFPEWLDYVTAIRVRERSEDGKVVLSEWEASVPMLGLKAKWVERDEWDEEQKFCRFTLQEGDLDKYDGDWFFTAAHRSDVGCLGSQAPQQAWTGKALREN
ncbi:MAG: type II toxin-antitoxin system RatA family toxin [Armatimonadota bacterium]